MGIKAKSKAGDSVDSEDCKKKLVVLQQESERLADVIIDLEDRLRRRGEEVDLLTAQTDSLKLDKDAVLTVLHSRLSEKDEEINQLMKSSEEAQVTFEKQREECESSASKVKQEAEAAVDMLEEKLARASKELTGLKIFSETKCAMEERAVQ